MDILDDMGVSKLSAKVFSKVNYFFSCQHKFYHIQTHRSALFLCLRSKVNVRRASQHLSGQRAGHFSAVLRIEKTKTMNSTK